MKNFKPERIASLSEKRRTSLLQRSMEEVSEVFENVRGIVGNVRQKRDAYLVENHIQFKKRLVAGDLKVQAEEIKEAYGEIGKGVLKALRAAAGNIQKFHQAQMERSMWMMEVAEGILAGRVTRPIETVGAYIPGGKANYPSSALMNIIPAKVAGVGRIIACTPPQEGMRLNPNTLVALDLAGATTIFKLGGPWAIGAMAYGTESVPRVDKIVGPGNKYVAAAKMAVFGAVDIDSPAGPSEALILADETARPDWLTWDFLSQVEHDADAGAVLVTTSEELAEAIGKKIAQELPTLARREIIEEALQKHSALLIADTMDEAVDFTNTYASEHLQIVTRDPWTILPRIKHAGSIFMGPYAPVPAGDYASGTNHVLPTGGCARMFSGLSVDDFIKKPTFQFLNKTGLAGLRKTVVTLAEQEGLPLHARAVEERFK
jgi:histidinol dehydrogenase